MNRNEIIAAEGFLFGIFLKKHSNMTKAYVFLFAASFYSICAAREANNMSRAAFEKLNEERQRPVIVVES